MSWRVVVVSQRCKLEYKLGYLICRGEQTKKVFIEEISTLIVESTAVAITSALLSELIKNKVNIIFCDEKHNPQAQLTSLYARHDCSGILKLQLRWSETTQINVWTEIVRLKIEKQMQFLQELNSEQAQLLKGYIQNIRDGDLTNREGHSAKVYFNALFGLGFKRGDSTFVNAALNYGYAVLLSAFNREIVGMGYNTQLGLNHRNEFNKFNLSCDLIEPFRVIVDRFVFNQPEQIMCAEYKHSLCNILNLPVKIGGMNCTVNSAISIYCRSVFSALESNDVALIVCYEL
jgi:CRISPR-associated endonuclease Cas1 subtype II